MTRKDYIKIAQVFKTAYRDLYHGDVCAKPKEDMLESIVSGMIVILKQDNSRFDNQKFIDYIYGD